MTDWLTLLEGVHCELFFKPAAATSTLCITFDALDAPHRPPHIPLDAMVASRGAAHAHVATRRNDWYHNPDLPALSSALERLSETFGRVILYGSSMGGYGALMLSGATRAHRVVAIAPQFNVDPARPPFEARWRHLTDGIAFGAEDLSTQVSSSADKYIMYDPGFRDDAAHAALLAKQPNTYLVRMPGAGHYPLQFLHQGGIMNPTLEDLIFGAPDLRKLRHWRRSMRSRSSRYLCQLAIWFAHRKNLAAACRTLSQAVIVNPDGPEAIESTITAFYAICPGEYDGIIFMMLRLLHHEQPTWTHYRPMLQEYTDRFAQHRATLKPQAVSDRPAG